MDRIKPLYPVRAGTLSSKINATLYIFNNRFTTFSRYKGQVIMSIVTPIVIAA